MALRILGPQNPGSSGPGPVPNAEEQSFTYVQDVAATTWTFVHPLGFHPAGVRVVDYSDPSVEWSVDVDYSMSQKRFTLRFPEPVRGEVTVS